MDPRRWQHISSHFERLVELPPAQRDRELQEVDPDLRDELRALLDAHDTDGELEIPESHVHALVSERGTASPEIDDDLIGTTIGPYRIGARIGVGGMGVVHLADDTRADVARQVAVKVIKRGMDTEHIVARFRAEQNILASLDHEGIARMLDVGVLPDDRPYLVMEYVDGVPIDVWCRERQLPLAARLRLFRAVCDAVHHAHRALVVHRDLKPSNILVTHDGRVKLLDFGIAKLLDPDPETSPRTLTGLVPMTPQYASPEQVRGEMVTTAVDVYGLGVLLHLLLTDRHPIDDGTRDRAGLLAAVVGARPPRPSEAAPDRARQLRGDLDLVVRVAMHPDPAQRYDSALALGDDVGRHLRGLPLHAHADSVLYTAGKFVRRHRTTVVLSVVALVAVLGAGVATAVQSHRIAQQAEQIRLERDRAEQVQSLVVDMFDVSDPIAGDPVRGDTLRVRDFLRLNQQTMLERLDDQPAVAARFAHLLARLQVNLGQYDEAAPLAERSVELRRSLYDDHPDLAASLDFLGTVNQYLGRFDRAETAFREALVMRRRLFGERHRQVAESLNNLSGVLFSTGRIDSGLVLDEAALAIRREVLGPRDSETVQSLNNLGASYLQRDEPEVAEPLLRQALEARRELLGPTHPRVANTMNNLARTLLDLERTAEAKALFREAIGIWERTLGDEHPRLAGGYYNLSLALEREQQVDEAIDAMLRSHDIDRASYPDDHPYVGESAFELGRMLLARERRDEATPFLERALRIHLARYDDDTRAEEIRTLLARAQIPAVGGAEGSESP